VSLLVFLLVTSMRTSRHHLLLLLLLPLLLFLLLTAADVQIATRLLSAAPPLFWTAASICTDKQMPRWAPRLVVLAFVTYALLGAVLFTNFYPWT